MALSSRFPEILDTWYSDVLPPLVRNFPHDDIQGWSRNHVTKSPHPIDVRLRQVREVFDEGSGFSRVLPNPSNSNGASLAASLIGNRESGAIFLFAFSRPQ